MGLNLHKILIGIMLVGIIVSGLIVFLNDGTTRYVVADYNESNLESFNSITNEDISITPLIEDYNNNSDPSVNKDNIGDILGGFFTSIYTSAKVLGQSGEIVGQMANDASGQSSILGSWGKTFFSGLKIIVIILISVGIFLAFVVKSERA